MFWLEVNSGIGAKVTVAGSSEAFTVTGVEYQEPPSESFPLAQRVPYALNVYVPLTGSS